MTIGRRVVFCECCLGGTTMGRKSKKSESKTGGRPDASRDELKRGGWGFQQIGLESYCFLVVGVLSQAVTILVTWPAWQVREVPPNL
ncbi:hypothetical protein N9V88_03690, partial [bacterium]|nr:hypothetical protein [bacterium]